MLPWLAQVRLSGAHRGAWQSMRRKTQAARASGALAYCMRGVSESRVRVRVRNA
jgi:hypothetical protein